MRSDGERGAVRLQRLGQLALHGQGVADFIVARRQIPLPQRVVRVVLGQRLDDRELSPMGCQRLGRPALRQKNWGAARLSETSGCGRIDRNRRYRDGNR